MDGGRTLPATDETLDQPIAAVRRFNRSYTPLGVLDEGYLDSPFSVTQVRVLYELAHHERTTAAVLARELSLDPAYLSRILRRFSDEGLIERRRSETDARQSMLTLTDHGRGVFERLDRRSHDKIGAMLGRLVPFDRQRLVGAMELIEGLLVDRPDPSVSYVLRPPRPGDLGWIVQRHGALYADEYGWDDTFEALVAEIVAGYGRTRDPERERCWIAEMEGTNVGSVLCVRKSDEVAQLRLLLVEPEARGLGIGRRLVAECVRFSRSAGYLSVTLWTNHVLVTARRIYEAAGFRLVAEAPHRSFGHELIGQNWELAL